MDCAFVSALARASAYVRSAVIRPLASGCRTWIPPSTVCSYRRERLGGLFPDYVRGYREQEGWSGGRFEEYVTLELRRLLARAAGHAPCCRADLTYFTVTLAGALEDPS